jgi:hypothetical protein
MKADGAGEKQKEAGTVSRSGLVFVSLWRPAPLTAQYQDMGDSLAARHR